MANLLDLRADSTATSAASSAAPASHSASLSQSASAAASASSLASETGSITSETVITGTQTTSPSATSGASITNIIYETEPAFTATKSHAWHAHGVNATVNSTWIYTGTNTASTATSLPAGAVITGDGGNRTIANIPEDLIACRINGTIKDQSPFCSPEYGQELWVGHVYAANWNPTLFSNNATNYIEIHNANSTSDQDSIPYTSEKVPNVQGYINIEMLHEYLLDQAGNDTDSASNLTFHLISTPSGGEANSTTGPIINLTLDPKTLPKIPVKNPIPKKLGFEIGLPIGLVAFVIIGLSICCAIRKNKRNWGNVRHYGKDYIKKRNKRRGGKGKDIELNDYGFDSSTARAERFEDEPTRGGGNAFREEVERQKQEEYRNRAQKITSF